MSILMSGYEKEDGVALVADDFPWRCKEQHPSDYIESLEPIEPEFICHHTRGRHIRLWLRISWKLAESKFMPMSFLLDAGAPTHFYMADRAMAILEAANLVGKDEDTDVEYTTVFGRRCRVELVPVHQPANVIGLKMLKRLGLQLFEGEPHFSFSKQFKCLCLEELQ